MFATALHFAGSKQIRLLVDADAADFFATVESRIGPNKARRFRNDLTTEKFDPAALAQLQAMIPGAPAEVASYVTNELTGGDTLRQLQQAGIVTGYRVGPGPSVTPIV